MQAAVSTPLSHKSNTCIDALSTIGPGKSTFVGLYPVTPYVTDPAGDDPGNPFRVLPAGPITHCVNGPTTHVVFPDLDTIFGFAVTTGHAAPLQLSVSESDIILTVSPAASLYWVWISQLTILGTVSSQTSFVHTFPSLQSALVSHTLTISHPFDSATPCWTIACAMDGIVATTNRIARINSIHRIIPLLPILHSFLFLVFLL
jgi:hypothetical protein